MTESFDMRDYQQRASNAVFAEWEKGNNSTLIVLATGTGKTVIAGEIASRLPVDARLLFLVHREELMFQSRDKIQAMTGHRVALEGGEYRADRSAKFVVAMVQSLTKRLGGYDPGHFQYGIVDEAHHAVCKTYMGILDHFTSMTKVAGLTATPKRGDDVALGKVFDSVAYKMFAAEAIDLGWLTPIRSRVVTCNDMDLSQVRINVGDFNQTELKEQLLKQSVVHRIASESIAIADGRQTVVFCQNVDQSRSVCRMIESMGSNAVHVDGKISKLARRSRMAQFSEARVQFIVNCSVIEEGVDVPGIEVVANARPTRSQTRIVQAVGRGLRPIKPPTGATPTERCAEIADSTKPHCTVIDFVGNLGEHSMKVSGDLLGGDYCDDVRRIAIDLAREVQGDVDWPAIYAQAELRAIEEAKASNEDYALKRRQYAAMASESKWAHTYRPHPYAVFNLDTAVAQEKISPGDAFGTKLSMAIRFLEGEKLERREILQMSNVEQLYFARMLHRHISRGYCTWKQARRVHIHGYDPREMSKGKAGSLITRIQKNNWARPASDGPNLVHMREAGVASVADTVLDFS